MLEEKKLSEEDRVALIEEYRALNEAIHSRERSTLLVYSIIIPSSLFIVTFAISNERQLGLGPIFGLPIATWIPILATLLLLLPAYVLYYTTGRLDKIYSDRRDEVEKALKIKVGHHGLYEKKIKGKWWFRVRRLIWHLFFSGH